MKTLLLLESDNTAIKDYSEIIKEIDPQFNIKIFKSLDDFYSWIKGLAILKKIETKDFISEKIKEQKLIDTEFSLKISLLIFQHQFIKLWAIPEFEKIIDFFKKIDMVEKDQELNFIISTYLHDDFKLKKYYNPIFLNVIYLPLDRLITRETLKNSLKGRKAISSELYTHQTKTYVDMIKTVQITGFSELGFRTESRRPIDIGLIGRYYGDLFKGQRVDSLFARCYRSDKEADEKYSCSFSFFGMSTEQLRHIRHFVKLEKNKKLRELESKHSAPQVIFVAITPDEDVVKLMTSYLNDKFKDFQLEVYKAHIDFLNEYFPLKSKNEQGVIIDSPPKKNLNLVTGLFLHKIYFDKTKMDQFIESIKKLCGDNHQVKIFGLQANFLKTYKELEWANHFYDFFNLPLDLFYFTRKIKQAIPELINKEKDALSREVVDMNPIIKAGRSVKVVALSETHITIKYGRELKIGELRDFILPMENETKIPEIKAMCHFVEKADDEFKIHFLFFGLRDVELKYLRRWMVEEYIQQKGSE